LHTGIDVNRVSKSKLLSIARAANNIMRGLRELLYSIVLHFFKNINRKTKSRLSVWYMKEETSEHVRLLVKVFKWVVLPASLFYVCAGFCVLGENAIESILGATLVFFYSSFLPDLPSIYARKRGKKVTEDLRWYTKYALLLFAPIFILALSSGMQLRWKTTDNFHNLKSLMIYGAFLLLGSFFAFVDFPISIGDITEILSPPLYGILGYLIHLKVDKIW